MKRGRTCGRVACLLVRDFPAAARLRAEPDLADRPLAVVSGAGPRATVVAVSPCAARTGVHAGATLAHARALASELVVRVADPAVERAARDALLDVALSASPRVTPVAPEAGAIGAEAAVHLDASGLGNVFPGDAALAGALVERARTQGLPAVATVAASRPLALLAARDAALRDGPGAIRVVAPGGEAAYLAPLPVDLLAPDDAVADLLTRLGIHRIGALLDLPPGVVATRLGEELAVAVASLRGRAVEPPIAAPRAARCEEGVAFEAPIDRLEPLLFALGGPLSRLLGRLALRHLACAELEVELALDAGPGDEGGGSRGGRHALRLGLAAPTADARVWLRRLRSALEGDPPRAPVEEVTLAAAGAPARRDQLDLFRPAGPAPAALDALLAELETLCGEGRVGRPVVPDDPRPGAFALAPFTQTTQDLPVAGRASARSGEIQPHPALAVRALRPAVPAQVRVRGGVPARLRSAVANGDVVHCAGPWRSTGGWWSTETHFAYDCFDVATRDGLVVRLRHDRLRDAWHVDAVYD